MMRMAIGGATFGVATIVLVAIAVPNAVSARGEMQDGLKDPASFAAITDKAARSVALFAEMGKVIQSPRCLNCHPRTDRPLQGDAGVAHMPPVVRGKDGHGAVGLECATCHSATNVAFASGEGSIPGAPDWHLAPISMAWQGKSLGDICRQIKDTSLNGGKTLAQLIEHNGHDPLVGWGWHPGTGRTPAPGSQAQFGALTQAWVDSGAQCPA